MTTVNAEPPNQTATRKPRLLRWLAWGMLMLIGGTVVTALVSTCVTVAKDDLDSRWLPFLVVIVIWVVLFFGVKAATHPLRGRSEERPSWKQRFPAHTDAAIQRFLQVAGDSLGVSEKQLSRLRPDDRVAALTREWLCGDGMDIVELLLAIESEYALELPESYHERDRTLGDLFDYVSQQRTGPPPTRDSAKPNQAKPG
jgi:acyl carrier protein